MEVKLHVVVLFLSLLYVHFLTKEEHEIEENKAERKENKESHPRFFTQVVWNCSSDASIPVEPLAAAITFPRLSKPL